jgi:hypothetical protein
MKNTIIITLFLVAIFGLLRLSVLSSFLSKVAGVVFGLFGFLLVFALGDALDETFSIEVGGSLVITGILMVLFF